MVYILLDEPEKELLFYIIIFKKCHQYSRLGNILFHFVSQCFAVSKYWYVGDIDYIYIYMCVCVRACA